MDQENNRKRDMDVEHEIGKFMDAFFYSKNVQDFRRFQNKTDQLKGKDVSFFYKGKIILVDEKASTHYINKNIPTFAFELSFLNKGKELEGWLLDPSKETEYYLLMWVFAKKDWHICMEDITKVYCLLIERKKIIDYLAEEEWPVPKLILANDKIRNKGLEGAICKKEGSNIYFYCTRKLVEVPINVVIKRKLLRALSSWEFTVLPN